jgi:hypothetical protein
VSESGINYYQILLTQILRCGRFSPNPYRDLALLRTCVDRLKALLPYAIRSKIDEKVSRIVPRVRKAINEVCGRKVGGMICEAIEQEADAIVDRIVSSVKEASKYRNIIYKIVKAWNRDLEEQYIALLEFTIIIDVLFEENILSLENKQLFVGAPDVPG